jgi:amidase
LRSDPFGAFVRDTSVEIAGEATGPLAGLTFAVKDAFDIRGYVTGVGNPDWLRTHSPAESTAWAVQTLVNAGANLVAKTQTDELTYSLNGENIHYGTPINPRAPDRIPGGSSSGSAVAVAGGLVDFSIGTDCGGSVRAPASFCGIYGMRPSHGRISVDGVFPLAQSFDTVGWFAPNAKLLERVGRVLLEESGAPASTKRLLLAQDAFDWSGDDVVSALQPAVEKLKSIVGGQSEAIAVAPEGLPQWFEAFRLLQGAEIWANHGAWIRAVNPNIASDIRARFEWTSTISPQQVAESQVVRDRVTERMRDLLRGGTVLCLPTTPGIAPLLSLTGAELLDFRAKALSMLCIAGLARLPQINLPVGTIDGCPCGLSIVGAHGSDAQLLRLAVELAGK